MGRTLASPLCATPPRDSDDHRGLECTICLDSPHNPIVTFCGHLFCYDCLYEWIKLHPEQKRCPVCKTALSKVVRILGQGSEEFPHSGCGGKNKTLEATSPELDLPTVDDVSREITRRQASSTASSFQQDSVRLDSIPLRSRGFGTEEVIPRARLDSPMPRPYRTRSDTADLAAAVAAVDASPVSMHTPTSVSPARMATSSSVTSSPQVNLAANRTSHFRERRGVRHLSRWLHLR